MNLIKNHHIQQLPNQPMFHGAAVHTSNQAIKS